MKKSKIILAIALAVVFIITCISAPTFSWFTRPQSWAGKDMVLNSKNTYTAYNGKNVTISTKESTDDGVTYTKATTSYSGTEISPQKRKYFCTTITNNSGSNQNVSLYASTLSIPTATSNGTLALGVNGPTRSYRDYTSLATSSLKVSNDVMRIYFEKDNSVNGWNGTEFYICWNDDPDTNRESLDSTGSNGNYYKLQWVGGSNPNQYYADIPKTATHAFFAVENWGTNDNGQPKWSQRSQTLWNLASDGQSQTSSKLYKITSDTNNGNTIVHTPPYDVHGACINTYYSTISVATGNTFNAKLTSSEAIGNIRYESGDRSVFTVNETTGVITPVAAGEAILYTKSTGPSYNDTVQVETTVRVTTGSNYEFNDVPIVRNIQIPADAGSDENDPKNVVNVYWYVVNNSNSNKLTYTIDKIYLGL